MTLLAIHIKAARVLLDWNQRKLAEMAEVSLPTIQRMETSEGALRSTYETVQKVRRTLEAAGVEFLNDDQPGVRLRRRDRAGQA